MAIDDGEKLLVELNNEGMGVTAAAWLNEAEQPLWYLHVGLTVLDTIGVGEVYRVVNRCLKRIKTPSVQFSEIKLLRPSDPIARDIAAFRDRYSGDRMPTRSGSCRFGGVTYDHAYIYPRVSAGLTRAEVVQTVTGLLGRDGAVRPSNVTLRDGTAIRGIPCGLDIGRNVGQPALLEVKILDEADGSIRAVPVAEVANIQ